MACIKAKKVLSGLLTLVVLVGLAACQSVPKEDTSAQADGSNEKKEYKIAYVGGETANQWYVQTEKGVQEYAEATGINAFYKGPSKMDTAMQVQIIEDLISQDIDALLLCPFSPESVEPALKRAKEKGIVIIATEGSNIQSADYNVEACTASAYGEFIMQNLASLMGEEGKYVTMVGTLTTTSHNEWADAAIAYAEKNYPNMELIPERKLESEENMETAYERTKEILKKYPDLKGILGTCSFDAPGAAKAIKEMGLEGKVFTCGTSTVMTAETHLRDGSLPIITFWDPAETAKAMCNLAVMILEGEEGQIVDGLDLGVAGYENLTVEGNQLYGNALVACTPENMDQYNF